VAPPQVKWRGVLYITDRHSCWKADADSTTLMLPHSDVASVEKTEKGGQPSAASVPFPFPISSTIFYTMPAPPATCGMASSPRSSLSQVSPVGRQPLRKPMSPFSEAAFLTAVAGGKGSLRVAFGEQAEFLVLRDFVGGPADLDGALALLEHVTSGG